ncbi:glycosyltransferase [Helicobacter cetorum]|uniref:LPS biosynthesis protein n=1 Tax=Helicobacter cetorum (strain ATCC BAA-429 / MIT 00-7128) TaxID=182217 RepID=I0ENZ5_HELC0|nr:glycosyltransferase [Helicobacter cetorum]AFI04664.1 LPS biosynthesis protein [Helicobacter cetorum MIT 00-7128]
MTIPIIFAFDDNYAIAASVAFYSLLKNAQCGVYYKLYALHKNLSSIHQAKLQATIKPFKAYSSLEFIDVSSYNPWGENYIFHAHSKAQKRFGDMYLYKYLSASIFLNYDKIIFSDVDVVFCKDITESFINFNENKVFAGVIRLDRHKKVCLKEHYLIINLALIRKLFLEEKFLKMIKKYCNTTMYYESKISALVFDKIEYLPLKYEILSSQYKNLSLNQCYEGLHPHYYKSIKESLEQCVILHFYGENKEFGINYKPWINKNAPKAGIWFEILKNTAYKDDLKF